MSGLSGVQQLQAHSQSRSNTEEDALRGMMMAVARSRARRGHPELSLLDLRFTTIKQFPDGSFPEAQEALFRGDQWKIFLQMIGATVVDHAGPKAAPTTVPGAPPSSGKKRRRRRRGGRGN